MKERGNGWFQLLTCDGVPYYFCERTGQLQWDSPSESQTSSSQETESNHFYLPDPEEGWVPVRLTNDGTKFQRIFLASQKPVDSAQASRPLSAKEKARALPLKLSWLGRGPDDLVHCEALHEAQVLHALGSRYGEDKVYTSVGTILVVVNPFKQLPLYGPDQV